MRYPDKITPSDLDDIYSISIRKEACNRYNSHELLCNEIERLQSELNDANFYKTLNAIFGISFCLGLIILTFTYHVS